MNVLQWLAAVGLPAGASADAPELRVSKTVKIAAPVADVWAKCADFDAIDAWLSVVAKTTLTRGRNNQPGAVRHLDVKGGGYVDEELLSHDAQGHAFAYRILGGILPVTDYRSEFTLKAVGAHATQATWAATFRRKDTAPNPAAGADDDAATDAVSGLYAIGLVDLKRVAEGR